MTEIRLSETDLRRAVGLALAYRHERGEPLDSASVEAIVESVASGQSRSSAITSWLERDGLLNVLDGTATGWHRAELTQKGLDLFSGYVCTWPKVQTFVARYLLEVDELPLQAGDPFPASSALQLALAVCDGPDKAWRTKVYLWLDNEKIVDGLIEKVEPHRYVNFMLTGLTRSGRSVLNELLADDESPVLPGSINLTNNISVGDNSTVAAGAVDVRAIGSVITTGSVEVAELHRLTVDLLESTALSASERQDLEEIAEELQGGQPRRISLRALRDLTGQLALSTSASGIVEVLSRVIP